MRRLTDVMKKKGKTGSRLTAAVLAAVLGIAAAAGQAMPAMAMNEGNYLVTVKPSYKNPATGAIDDPGNNEAIGQGMTERMCGSTGLLEVDGSGRMHLTVRYYLSQFIKKVSFEEGAGNSFSSLSYEEMQSREAVEGASDLEEKYGYTDYRIPINSMDSVFRGNAYIEPMGRDVVYFFTFSDPMPGNGDFKVNSSQEVQTPAADIQSPGLQTREREAEPEGEFYESVQEETGEDEVISREADVFEGGNGSGQADDPVTGIPSKPLEAAFTGGDSVPETGETGISEEDFGLVTGYDLSAVPIEDARKLVEPMLKKADGITGGTYKEEVGAAPVSAGTKSGGGNGNRTVMMVLLFASALLLLQFPYSAFKRKRGNKAAPVRHQEPMEENGWGGRG